MPNWAASYSCLPCLSAGLSARHAEHALHGRVGQVVAEPLVELADLRDRVGLELGEADVEEPGVTRRIVPERENAVERDSPLLHVELADVGGIDAGIPALEHRVVQVRDGGQGLRHIPVRLHEARIGEHPLVRVEKHRVRRALEPPGLLGCAPLQQLQHALLVAVGGLHVAVREPVRVGGYVRRHQEDLGLELEGHQIVVLHRSGRGLRQHRPQAGGHVLVAQRHDGARHFHACFVGFGGHPRWRARIELFPDPKIAERGIFGQQMRQRRRARPRETDTEQLDVDLLLVDLRVPPIPVLDVQPVDQRPHEGGIERFLAELVELPFGSVPRERAPRAPPASCHPRSRRARSSPVHS